MNDSDMPRTAAETALLAALQRGDPTEKIHLASFVKGYLDAEARVTSQSDDMTTAYMVGLAKGRREAVQPAAIDASPFAHWIHHDPECGWHRGDPKGCDCGLALAEAAQPAPLDVERLASVLDALNPYWWEGMAHGAPGWNLAKAIAAEYARLAAEAKP